MLVRRGLILMFLCLIRFIGGIAQSFLKCKENDYEAEYRAVNAEAKIKLLTKTSNELKFIGEGGNA
ncbi:hypothetical protein HanXRQr2_Chr15g0713661 [Helianthus annuus]|uniref:Uncharacterized protein n=1 Tax=Helianthus annuus TaxID=4232 RepID=A0A9K3E3J6_HELAN|nr:hypothetical protein HanXRQr2_Chr15g0713661 [Helianthus annuus]KAJ0832970.1 hypothetical protein HanPSC8_Chr15g0684851 [Helianthus annuus]